MSEIGYLRRKWLNWIMSGLSSLAAGLAILVLALILGYTIVHGITFLNLDFLTQAAKPVGEAGGGRGTGGRGAWGVERGACSVLPRNTQHATRDTALRLSLPFRSCV